MPKGSATAKRYTNFDWIVPNRIAQGAYPGFHPSIFDSFDVVVYTAEEYQPKSMGCPDGKAVYALPLDDDIYRPVPPEVGKYAHHLAKILAGHAARGQKLLITCAMGANRSGLLTGLTLIYLNGMSGRSAVQLIKSRRKSGQQEALSNPMFEQYLLQARR